jgi:hypothetical protein
MTYKITRNLSHRLVHTNEGVVIRRLTDWAFYDVSFSDKIQSLYPTLSEDDYRLVLAEWKDLIAPLVGWIKFFTGVEGFISYDVTYDGWDQYQTITSSEQTFLFADQESYAAWQLQENQRSANSLCKWRAALEESSIDYLNISINGTQMVNTLTGETSNMPVAKYLTTDYFIQRQTQISISHSVVE